VHYSKIGRRPRVPLVDQDHATTERNFDRLNQIRAPTVAYPHQRLEAIERAREDATQASRAVLRRQPGHDLATAAGPGIGRLASQSTLTEGGKWHAAAGAASAGKAVMPRRRAIAAVRRDDCVWLSGKPEKR
jgi:hypothetical protein